MLLSGAAGPKLLVCAQTISGEENCIYKEWGGFCPVFKIKDRKIREKSMYKIVLGRMD